MPRLPNLSIELLRTAALLAHNDGEAGVTAQQLGINQPSMSKRLKTLQHAGTLLRRPWFQRERNRWCLTSEGRRVLPAVEEIVKRYERLTEFIAEPSEPAVRFACGQQAAQGFVCQAAIRFRRACPNVRLRISTLRGEARIEGVANGSLDLAAVTHNEAEIQTIARRLMHVERVIEDRFVIVCGRDSPWHRHVKKLSKTNVKPDEVCEFPLILPDRRAGVRRHLDDALHRTGLGRDAEIALEIGGGTTALRYAQEGFGVAIVSESVVSATRNVTVRGLDPAHFPPKATKLVCRWLDGSREKLDLSAEGWAFRDALIEAVSGTHTEK